MRRTSGNLDTYWLSTQSTPSFDEMEGSLSVDVLVIGAGITGLTAAYLLSRKGQRVAVVDSGSVWSGETGRTTAHLTDEMDFGYAEILKLHGLEKSRQVLESQRAALHFLAQTVDTLKIPCDFKRVDGFLFLHSTDSKETLTQEMEALSEIGYAEAELLDRAPKAPFDTGPCIRFPGQAQFHPLRYLNHLASEIVRAGGLIFTDTRIERVDSMKAVTADGDVIHASHIVVATQSPIKNILFFLKEAAYRSYVIAAEIPKGVFRPALYWDTGDHALANEPYHYVRVAEKNDESDLLIVGGEDHKTGQANDAEERFRKLETWARKRFPRMGAVECQWSGQVIEPVDALPFIGKSPYHKDIYIATGYSGNGMTGGTLAAMMISDLILGIKNEWTDLYSPTRKNVKSGRDFLEENLGVARQIVSGRLQKSDVESEEDLAPGEGAVLSKGLAKVAAYRDESGRLTECSATCPHLGCVVSWNKAEKTFDCPCHGSRFTGEGKVITGPSNTNLKTLHPATHL